MVRLTTVGHLRVLGSGGVRSVIDRSCKRTFGAATRCAGSIRDCYRASHVREELFGQALSGLAEGACLRRARPLSLRQAVGEPPCPPRRHERVIAVGPEITRSATASF